MARRESGLTGSIFFVLSGYLITGKLLEDGSLRKFYTRRAFRILPVLLTVSVACLSYYLMERPLTRLGHDIASGVPRFKPTPGGQFEPASFSRRTLRPHLRRAPDRPL